MRIAVADMGGTTCRFAHFRLGRNSSTGAGELSLHRVVQCPTAELRDTHDALARAATTGLAPHEAQAVVWAVAGPVHDTLRAHTTNASLAVDLSILAGPERAVACINDFAAQAWATLALPGQEAVEILPGTAVADHAADVRGVLGAGTGLGTATLVRLTAERYHALAAEGGHVAFPWRNRHEADFGEFVCGALDIPYACGDQVLSGRGLALLHHFLTGKDWPVERVSAEGLGPDSPTLRTFARFYGRMCRHWVLQTLCTGGLFLTGGVAVKNPRIVRSPAFAEEFYDAPPGMLPLLRATPVRLMTREHAGLWGAARCAQELLESHPLHCPLGNVGDGV